MVSWVSVWVRVASKKSRVVPPLLPSPTFVPLSVPPVLPPSSVLLSLGVSVVSLLVIRLAVPRACPLALITLVTLLVNTPWTVRPYVREDIWVWAVLLQIVAPGSLALLWPI